MVGREGNRELLAATDEFSLAPLMLPESSLGDVMTRGCGACKGVARCDAAGAILDGAG